MTETLIKIIKTNLTISNKLNHLFHANDPSLQLYKSNGGTVYIRETNGQTSGNYKCEISVEGTFQTVAAEKLMTVVGKA